MRKLLLPIAVLLLTVCSCSDMDPFMGTDGIRFNMNGKKYVMQKEFFGLISPMSKTDDGIIISASLTGPSALDMCYFTLNLCLEDQLAVDKEYKTGENGISANISTFSVGLSDLASAAQSANEEEVSEATSEAKEEAAPVQLQGWVKRVASEDASKLEVLFEFSGKDAEGNEYVIKHGFLRL